ncbi:MAG: polyhydroxyalkanoate depolymerase [Gammaproteobacteria bacterium]
MLYQNFDLYQRSLQLWNPFFDLSRKIITDNVSRYTDTLTGQSLNAFLEMGMDFTKAYGKPEFGIDKMDVDMVKYHVTEEVVLSKPFCNLLQFRHTDEGTRPRVLLIAALSGHHATLCKSTIEALLPEHDLFVTDWMDAKHVPVSDGRFGFEEYISYLIEFLQLIGPNTHVIAVCQPTVQALMATAIMSEQQDPATPTSLTLMAGPVDTRVNANEVHDFANEYPRAWYKETLIHTVPLGYAGAGRKVYPGFLQLWCFMAMNMGSHLNKFSDFYLHLIRGDEESVDRHREFYDEYFAVLDLTEEFYMETMDRVFREHHLANGLASYQGEPVNLGAISNTALFTVEGENDDICAVGQTEAAQGMCENIPSTMRKHLVQPGVGHYGVFSGSKFRDLIAPKIASFIRKFDKSREEVSFKKVAG